MGTGGNGGIGAETAKELLLRGAIVYIACRNVEKAELVRQSIIELVPGLVSIVNATYDSWNNIPSQNPTYLNGRGPCDSFSARLMAFTSGFPPRHLELFLNFSVPTHDCA